MPLRKLLFVIAVIPSVVFTGAAFAADEADVLFFAPFEDSLHATVSRGQGKAQAAGSPRFGAGMRGKAVVLDPASLLTYVFKDNVVPDEGTIMMWFKPEWRADDDKFHNLFRASTGNFGGKALNALILYKYPRWARLALYTSNGQKTAPYEGRSMAFRNEMKFPSGEWVHVAGTWSATMESTEMYLYVDGERAAACGGAVFLPERQPPTFEIGGPEGSGTTWFDDVLLFSRPLMAPEVKAMYESYRGQSKLAPDELPFVSSRELQLRPHVLFGAGKLVVLVDYRGARRELAGRQGRVRLELQAGGGNMSAEREAPLTGVARFELDYNAVGAGVVALSATLRDGTGKMLRAGKLSCRVPEKPVWLGNRLGKSDQVPPPWTPLRAAGGTVHVWGREYRLDQSPLPTQRHC